MTFSLQVLCDYVFPYQSATPAEKIGRGESSFKDELVLKVTRECEILDYQKFSVSIIPR